METPVGSDHWTLLLQGEREIHAIMDWVAEIGREVRGTG